MDMETTLSSLASTADGRRARRLRYLIPILTLVGLLLMFGWALNRDPSTIPSALIGQAVPEFKLSPVKGRALGLSSADLTGEVALVNVFASWCVECRTEHSLLLRLKGEAVLPIYGLDYKDRPDDAAKWLDSFGDPYTRTGADLSGRVAIDWGVYGVPETFVVSRDGHIAYKHIGPLSTEALDQTILPLITRLRQQ